LPASFSAAVPVLEGLDDVVAQSAGHLNHDAASKTLTVVGPLDRHTYRALLKCCAQHEQRAELESTLQDLRNRSSLYIGDDELQSLETFARRMRGEIFFAERWLIVEGQADYMIVHALAAAMGCDLDLHGISVIDAQNNGNPVTFAALARALAIPWRAVFDGDEGGQRCIRGIRKRGFTVEEISNRCWTHPAGDLEAQLVADGLGPVLRDILTDLHVNDALELANEALLEQLRSNKTSYAGELVARLRSDSSLAQRAPEAFRTTIDELSGLA